MTSTITKTEAKTLIPQLVEQSKFSEAIVIKEDGQTLAALISADDYAFLVEARRRERVRETTFRAWETKFNSPEWREAIAMMDDFRNQLADVDDEKLMADLDEAVVAVRKEPRLQPI